MRCNSVLNINEEELHFNRIDVVLSWRYSRVAHRAGTIEYCTMADFDAIYEEEEENEQNLEEQYVKMVPDPIVIRGAGNMTV